jgi:diguanylate cyclase (GGDEF)-like protein
MLIDNTSLLIAIAFSGAALLVALVISWLNTRSDSFLVSWSVGMALIVAALAALGLSNGAYDLIHQLVPYALLISGLVMVLAGAFQFRLGRAPVAALIAFWIVAETLMIFPLVTGWSGIATIALNSVCAVAMLLSAWQYWRTREEATLALAANAFLYALTGLSFLACAVALVVEQSWVIYAWPSNWAEEFNSIMSIAGMSGAGALSLTLTHARSARRHRLEANTDALTGVLNRRALFHRFETGRDLPAGTAVLMLDLDHFKQVNDRRGHAAGDRVLQQFADVLRAHVRTTDAVARVGGEEFCAVLVGVDRDRARAIAERIRAGFETAAIPIGADDAIATVSIGMATAGSTETFTSVLNRADAALYKAKRGGRNQVQSAALRLVA